MGLVLGCAASFSYASDAVNGKDSEALEAIVRDAILVRGKMKTMPELEKIRGVDLKSLRCLGMKSFSVGSTVVGVCTVDGDRGEPNSDATFGITVFQKDLESERLSVSVKLLTGEV